MESALELSSELSYADLLVVVRSEREDRIAADTARKVKSGAKDRIGLEGGIGLGREKPKQTAPFARLGSRRISEKPKHAARLLVLGTHTNVCRRAIELGIRIELSVQPEREPGLQQKPQFEPHFVP